MDVADTQSCLVRRNRQLCSNILMLHKYANKQLFCVLKDHCVYDATTEKTV